MRSRSERLCKPPGCTNPSLAAAGLALQVTAALPPAPADAAALDPAPPVLVPLVDAPPTDGEPPPLEPPAGVEADAGALPAPPLFGASVFAPALPWGAAVGSSVLLAVPGFTAGSVPSAPVAVVLSSESVAVSTTSALGVSAQPATPQTARLAAKRAQRARAQRRRELDKAFSRLSELSVPRRHEPRRGSSRCSRRCCGGCRHRSLLRR
jgi:hypothetical protein